MQLCLEGLVLLVLALKIPTVTSQNQVLPLPFLRGQGFLKIWGQMPTFFTEGIHRICVHVLGVSPLGDQQRGWPRIKEIHQLRSRSIESILKSAGLAMWERSRGIMDFLTLCRRRQWPSVVLNVLVH